MANTSKSLRSEGNLIMPPDTIQIELGTKQSRPAYPHLNLYFSTRVFRNRVDQRSTPLRLYTRPVKATNIARIYNQPIPSLADLRELEMRDGMIYQMGCLKRTDCLYNPQDTPPLKVKLLLCVCMYNESKNAINLTLQGIYNNLVHLREEGLSPEEVGVVLMQDGILKLVKDRQKRNYAKSSDSMVEFYRKLDEIDGKPRCQLQERINTVLDEIENFKRRGMQSMVTENRDFPPSIQKNIALLYQNLWYPGIQKGQRLGNRKCLKVFSCFKHLNGTKLSSHLWFFEGFCRYLEPQFIVLLDVGTKPDQFGVINLLKGFTKPTIGGVAGLLSVDSSFKSQQQQQQKKQEEESSTFQCLRSTFFSVERAQQYEYIISHFIDKNEQSFLGFLHVLPGAWSAYRYRALMVSDRYEPNLLEHSYFKMMLNPDLEQRDHKQANMYLAEDRILSLGIYCQPGQNFSLYYAPNAIARTDPMKSHQDLMKQRRRWINSSLYAFLYVWKNFHFNASESSHGPIDKYLKLNFSMTIAMLSLVNAYMSPSITFYIMYTTIVQINIGSTAVFVIARIASGGYALLYLVGVGGSLSGAAWLKNSRHLSVGMAFYNIGLMALVMYNVLSVYLALGSGGVDPANFTQMSVTVMVVTNIGLFAMLIILHLFTHPQMVMRLMADQISYIFYQGAYTQTLVIHAFCNIDDVSWGTKGSQGGHGSGKKYAGEKIKFVSTWLFLNAIFAYICIYIDEVVPNDLSGPNQNRRIMLIAIGYYFTAYFIIKIGLAICNQLGWIFTLIFSQCCQQQRFPNRLDKMEEFWKKINKDYAAINKA